MAEKILKTRIQLRYDTLANWVKNDPVLKAGEIAIATIPTPNPASKQLPPVMFKVGTYDGINDATKKKFSELDWASGLAADVYDWAKKATPDYNDLANKPTIPTVGNGKITINQGGKEAGSFTVNQSGATTISLTDTDTNTQYQLVLSGHTLKLQSKEKSATAWTDVSGQSFELPDSNTTYTFAEGSTDGAFSVTPSGSTTATSVKIHGLGTAAYKADTAFDTAGAAAAVLGKSTDAATANTVYGANKAAANAQSAIDDYKTSNDTALAAVKATADAAQTSAQVDAKISTHNTSTTAHNDIRQSITALAEKVSGRATGYVFKNKTDTAYTTAIGKTGSFVVGDTIYFTDTNISDRWVTAVNSASPYYTFQDIETEKTDLTGYVKGTDLTANKIIFGNDGSSVKVSTYGISDSITAGDNANVPTSGAVSTELGKKQNSLTAAQSNAVNSGITAAKVSTYDGYADTITNKQDALSTTQLSAVNSGITADKVKAYDGYATTIAGKQDTLSTTQLAAVNSGITSALVTKYNGYEATINGKQDKITSSNKLAASLVSGLATVATSGSYNDLEDKPTIPSAAANAALKDTSGQTIFTANASEDVTITVIDCGNSSSNW